METGTKYTKSNNKNNENKTIPQNKSPKQNRGT